jgi:hypothetical protein
MTNKNIIIWGILAISVLIFGITIMEKSTRDKNMSEEYKIIFLHHSTGEVIYAGGENGIRFIRRFIKPESPIRKWIRNYNQVNRTNYAIEERVFPQTEPYGWKNYPYDYYNIWVKNAGEQPYMNEPTLEILTKQYKLIIFKHCFPVGDIQEDINQPNINSEEKRLENYKLQYQALKQKLLEFHDTRFLVWTGAAQVMQKTTETQAARAKAFFDWVKNEWDTPNDNIFLFDFYELETEGALYLKPEYAVSPDNSHPNQTFAKKAYPLFCERIIEVIEQNK